MLADPATQTIELGYLTNKPRECSEPIFGYTGSFDNSLDLDMDPHSFFQPPDQLAGNRPATSFIKVMAPPLRA